jgi:Rrf2 family transcriptional regulator, cysteine metabolism repressor
VWISRRTDYATRAVLELAVADGGPLKIGEIATRAEIPQSVLEQVLPVMRTAGLIRSERGPHGGYRLNHPPEEITLERVVRLFQGQLAPIGYATRQSPDPCPDRVARTLLPTWAEVRDATIDILARTTFAELAERAASSGKPSARR